MKATQLCTSLPLLRRRSRLSSSKLLNRTPPLSISLPSNDRPLDAQITGDVLPLWPREDDAEEVEDDDEEDAGPGREVLEEAESLARTAIYLAWLSARMGDRSRQDPV